MATSVPGNDNFKYQDKQGGSVFLTPVNQEPYPGASLGAYPVEMKTTESGGAPDPLGLLSESKASPKAG